MNAHGLIAYSSLTGNTKQLAAYIHQHLARECVLADIKENPAVESAEWIIAGFWVDKGTADAGFLNFISSVKGKNICLIGTLGVSPDSDHARDVISRVKEEVEKENHFLGCYLCQGKISPKLTKAFESFPKGHPHYMDDDRRKRHAEAAKHPDEQDLLKGLQYCREALTGV